jgi:MFS transporter, DHA3 family, macrolide efflux protein
LTARLARLSGMQKFSIIWLGTFVSIMGTAMTRFALLVWAFQQTGQALTTALLGFFGILLYVLLSPVAGVITDRYDRRLIMIVADTCSAALSLFLLIQYQNNSMQIWHLYLLELMTGGFDAFYLNAYSTTITLLVPKEHYARASGMRSLANEASRVFAPALGGLLLGWVGLGGVLVIDMISFLLGFIPLLLLSIPRSPRKDIPAFNLRSFINDLKFGLNYIAARVGLRQLLSIYAGINLMAGLTWYGVLAPMVLARTGQDELSLAAVQGAMGVGGVLGGLFISLWGGPRNRIHGILGWCGVSFFLGDLLIGLGQAPVMWMIGVFMGSLFIPVVISSEQAIWGAKVDPTVQGRVFAVKDMLRTASTPVGYLLGGLLADRFFEPLVASGTMPFLDQLTGGGVGSGMSLMFICTGLIGASICFGGYLLPHLRNIERELPDHDHSVVA